MSCRLPSLLAPTLSRSGLGCVPLRPVPSRCVPLRPGRTQLRGSDGQVDFIGPILATVNPLMAKSEATFAALTPLGRDFDAQSVPARPPRPSKVMVSLQSGAKITKSHFSRFCHRETGPEHGFCPPGGPASALLGVFGHFGCHFVVKYAPE